MSVKGWYDGHPEIGKMQKDIFDDIFDTTDDGVAEEEDPEPIVPKPNNFEVSISSKSNDCKDGKIVRTISCLRVLSGVMMVECIDLNSETAALTILRRFSARFVVMETRWI